MKYKAKEFIELPGEKLCCGLENIEHQAKCIGFNQAITEIGESEYEVDEEKLDNIISETIEENQLTQPIMIKAIATFLPSLIRRVNDG